MACPPREYNHQHLMDRFWSQVDRSGECWIWTGYINPQTGYGQFTLNISERSELGAGRIVSAPRFACTQHLGAPPDGAAVLHSCDNRACVRPAHLRWGTVEQNNREAWDRNRQQDGERHHQAKLSDDAVRQIRLRADRGERVASLAEEFGIDRSYCFAIVRGDSRKGVQV